MRETYGGFVVERASDSSASEIYPQRGAAEEARRALILHYLDWDAFADASKKVIELCKRLDLMHPLEQATLAERAA